ncbi:hypothetical protein IB244_18725 [Rhizobium sp. RHZ02]|uniref:hypothetical protein n=1 Tax=Rhizobium sp. RHZ02 TaxID=2769306 RepID=UPI00178083A2|nr:hypothetical protein [Rhizobium sp. RHZ02]MBD9453572.1 hypothetical protein [Rhizobium sp. RHZ02]
MAAIGGDFVPAILLQDHNDISALHHFRPKRSLGRAAINFAARGFRSGILARDKLAVFHHIRGKVDWVRCDFATRQAQRVWHREIKFAMENLLFDWFLFAG